MLLLLGAAVGCLSLVSCLTLHAPVETGNASVKVLGNRSDSLGNSSDSLDNWSGSPPSSKAKRKLYAKQNFFVSFSVCNGAAIQHIALVQGLAIGRAMGAVVILPDLYSSYSRAISQKVAFHDVYDADWLRNELKDVVTIVRKSDIQVTGMPEIMNAYRKRYTLGQWKSIGQNIRNQGKRMLHFTCTYDSVSALKETSALELLWRIHGAIRPAPLLAQIVSNMTNLIRKGSPTGQYSALHLRAEKDWADHCRVRTSYNCMTNVDNLHSVFAIERVPFTNPVYIASGLTKSDFSGDSRFSEVRNNYRFVMKQDLVPDIFTQFPLESRYDILGVIDFYVCADSDIFIGNGRSAFSALLELGRRRPEHRNVHPERRALHYNGGPIPLSAQMPIDGSAGDGMVPVHRSGEQMKWVFTIGTGLTRLFFEHLKVSVMSALANTTLQPTCLYVGLSRDAPPDPVEKWLLSVGVVVIRHLPTWREQLSTVFKTMPADLATTRSTNFGSLKALVATYLRVDIPILGFVDKYILYADVDTLFVSDPAWTDFAGPHGFPTAYTMGTENIESTNPWDGNAGVMFLNLHYLGESYDDFLSMTFSDKYMKEGLVYNGQPADQGAYKVMYHSQTTLVSHPPFNWRPYWKATDDRMFGKIKIVHFIGPKIPDYNVYFGNGTLTNPLFKGIIGECEQNREDCEYWVYRWRDTYLNCVANGLPCGSEKRMSKLRETALLLSSFNAPAHSQEEVVSRLQETALLPR